jgi:hypothetical protein
MIVELQKASATNARQVVCFVSTRNKVGVVKINDKIVNLPGKKSSIDEDGERLHIIVNSAPDVLHFDL